LKFTPPIQAFPLSISSLASYLKPVRASTAILLAGPTASGKSALALRLAEQLGGTIINADSMQVYRSLRIITARPKPHEKARVYSSISFGKT
jgi:hypothetical protein